MNRHTLLPAFVGVALCATRARPIGAQEKPIAEPIRGAPSLGSMGIKPSNQVIPNAIVTWGYWGVNAYACTDNAKFTECLIHVANGGDNARSLCLGQAALLYAATDSVAIALKIVPEGKILPASPTDKPSNGMVCVTVPAHGQRSVVAQSGSFVTRKPLGLAVSLEEQLTGGPKLTARTRVPLLAITP